jgi:polygalacturonase
LARRSGDSVAYQGTDLPDRDFDATRYNSINDAINACNQAGGGRVVVPAGARTVDPIRLRSRVNLHLSEGAVLKFTTDPKRYLPVVFTRWEGTELMNYAPFIYAFDEQDIAITGTGTLDGQASATQWWDWTGRLHPHGDALWTSAQTARRSPSAFLEKDRSCAPNFIQPYRCRNVLIEGVTIVNSPMWEVHPVLCTNVIVRRVLVNSHGPNNDGCNPESCRDVLIEGLLF